LEGLEFYLLDLTAEVDLLIYLSPERELEEVL